MFNYTDEELNEILETEGFKGDINNPQEFFWEEIDDYPEEDIYYD